MPTIGPSKPTYSMGAAARLTGLSPALLRAWERRHAVVQPLRTPGGTRRYRESDLERLRLVKAAVEAGHRVGRVAGMSDPELRACAGPPGASLREGIDEILAALIRLDGPEAQRLLSLGLASLGSIRFASELSLPLLEEIGERWARGGLDIAAEHLASSVLRSMLGSALKPGAASLGGPRVLFATPIGERHELGLQMAALTAMGAGANPLYLGTELAFDELAEAARRGRAAAVAIGVVTLEASEAERQIARLRGALAPEVRIWVGGSGGSRLGAIPGVETVARLELLEGLIASLRHAGAVEAR